MPVARKTVSIGVLIAASLLLTAFWNSFSGIIYDYAHNLYFAGLGSLVVGLLIHVLIVRRCLPRTRVSTQLIGVALSGIIAIVFYDLFHELAAHLTFAQRSDVGVNWGDNGRYSGLPALGTGFEFRWFFALLPRMIGAALIYGIVWFPLLVFLERWTYVRSSASPSSPEHVPA